MRTIAIKVIPNSKKNEVSGEDGKIRVHVNSPAIGGKANKAVIGSMAGFLNVKKKDIKIIRGERSREKIIEVTE